MSDAQRLLGEVLGKLQRTEEANRPRPEATPPVGHRPLAVVMATYDDFSGVWFTVQALRLFHSEVGDDLAIVVLDNHPGGRNAAALKDLDSRVPALRYVPFEGYTGTAVRDLAIREADADVIVCVDSHVLLAPGALRAVLDYFDAHPDSRDLLQGPLLHQDGNVRATHMVPSWSKTLFGTWATDHRGLDPDAEPFEIPMHGLGVFAFRSAAWPGFNPRLRGFGGEEGYLHEKFRRAGARTLCHPKLRWQHRFGTIDGHDYPSYLEDRFRNYRIAWEEVGWDFGSAERVLSAYLREEADVDGIATQTRRQATNPFMRFDAIFCLNLDGRPDRWAAMQRRFAYLDITWRVERWPAVPTPENHHRGTALSWRAMIAEAQHRSYETLLVFEDDAIFLNDTLDVVTEAVAQLDDHPWDLCFLGGVIRGNTPQPVGPALTRTGPITTTHALAIHERAYARLLADIPSAGDRFDAWLDEHIAIDQYFATEIAAGTYHALLLDPRVATQAELLSYPLGDMELAACYTII